MFRLCDGKFLARVRRDEAARLSVLEPTSLLLMKRPGHSARPEIHLAKPELLAAIRPSLLRLGGEIYCERLAGHDWVDVHGNRFQTEGGRRCFAFRRTAELKVA